MKLRAPNNPLAGLPREVGVLVVVAFLVALGFGIVAPAIPLFAKQFGVSNFAAGGVISIFAVARLIWALPGGRLVDLFGERRVLSAGIWIVGISSALAGLAQSYDQLLVLRGVGGIGSAMFTVSGLSLLLRVAGPEQRGRASSAFQGGFLLGGISGPVIGGFVTAASVRAPFFFYAFTLLLAGIAAQVMLKSSSMAARERGADGKRVQPPEGERGFAPLWRAMRQRPFVTAMFVNFSSGFTAFGLRASLIPTFVVEDLGRTAVLTGIGTGISALVTAVLLLPAGRLSDTRGRRPALIYGTSGVAIGMALLALTNGVPLFLVGMGFLGVGAAFMGSAPAAVVGDVAGSKGGTVVAAFQMASDVGSISGPLIAGTIADGAGFGPAFATGAIVSLCGLLLSATMPETLKRSTGSRKGAPAPTPADD
jgi:DHA1 family multidrug resistance protein-like MFS transporter